MNLPEAVEVSRQAGLSALRLVLAQSLEEAPVDKRAPLAVQLREVMRELESLPTAKASPVDEIKARRDKRRAPAKRGAATKDQSRSAGGK